MDFDNDQEGKCFCPPCSPRPSSKNTHMYFALYAVTVDGDHRDLRQSYNDWFPSENNLDDKDDDPNHTESDHNAIDLSDYVQPNEEPTSNTMVNEDSNDSGTFSALYGSRMSLDALDLEYPGFYGLNTEELSELLMESSHHHKQDQDEVDSNFDM